MSHPFISLRRFKVIVQSSSGIGDKLGVAGVALLLYGVSMGEIVRLSLGGKTARQ